MARDVRYTQEPTEEDYRPLDSDIYENEEYYLYYDENDNEFVRRKIGGWVNLSHFIPLITNKKDEIKELEEEMQSLEPHHKKQIKTISDRYYGVWSTLYNARQFAKRHGIYDVVEPILAFNRVAMVKYMGYQFYEYFACPYVDIAIRVLRDVNGKYIERINMDQIFMTYKRCKGSANLQLQRSFYTYHQNIFKRGEATLLGGHWTDRKSVIKFTKKHGFFKLLKPILDFPLNDPSKQEEYPIDVVQVNLLHYWKATSCDDSFYGFPKSFKGGLAPKRPIGEEKKKFRYTDLIVEQRFNLELTKSGGFTYKKNLTLLRRLSDGAMNASMLVSICVLLKANELELSKDDPYLLMFNELYQRDQLENVEYESIVTDGSKYLNGKWCSVEDARFLFGQYTFKEAKEVEYLRQFLYDERLEKVAFLQDDNDEVKNNFVTKEDMEEDDEFVQIEEDDFKKVQHEGKREPIFKDPKFFDDETSSEEEELESADFNDFEDVQGFDVYEEHGKKRHVGEDSSDDDEDFDNNKIKKRKWE